MEEHVNPSLWLKVSGSAVAFCLWVWKSVLEPFGDVKKDIAVIKANHMAHVEKYAEEIRDLKRREIERDERDHKIIEQLGHIRGMLESQ